jgi:Type I restriction enzyme R protein N terminus (HSDR_N)
MNEQDIREEVIAPLIKKLGYQSGTFNNVIREQSLIYARAFIGRKDLKKDPVLRGKADYILEAGSLVRWVIEAKAPSVEIDLDAIEQAYTYANHPEVRAVYFVVCNGRKWMVFQTNSGPNEPAVLDYTHEQLESNYQTLHNLLSPESLIRDCPKIQPDTGSPIGQGLRSVVRVTSGKISYISNSINLTPVNELEIVITDGSIERNEHDKLITFLTTDHPIRSVQSLIERMGLASFEMQSEDFCLSADASSPTVFRSQRTMFIPKGEKLIDISTWNEIELPDNMTCFVSTEASGHLHGNIFFGKFLSMIDFNDLGKLVRLEGEFRIVLA